MYLRFWQSLGYHGGTLNYLNSITPLILWGSAFAVAVGIVGIIAMWRIFKKCGEPGWKSLIPFYNVYTLCKLTWKTDFFWIQLMVAIVAIFCSNLQTLGAPWKFIFGTAAALLLFLYVFLNLVGNHRISMAFGHGMGFTFGLWFFPFIFMLILAFGSSEYKGNVYMKLTQDR